MIWFDPSPRFNWATPVKAWRSGQIWSAIKAGFWLQLGHAGEGVEMFESLFVRAIRTELQLGHAGEGVEITVDLGSDNNRLGFNWATPVKAWR